MPSWEFAWAGGLHFFGPTRTSLAFGGGLRREEADLRDRARYVFVFGEPGFGALRLSTGYAESVGSAASGWSLRGSLLKLTHEPSRRSFVGVEAQVIAFFCLGGRVGAFRPLAHDAERRTLVVADLSICL